MEKAPKVLVFLFVGTCLESFSKLLRPNPPQGLVQLCHVRVQKAEEQDLCFLDLVLRSLGHQVPQFGVLATKEGNTEALKGAQEGESAERSAA